MRPAHVDLHELMELTDAIGAAPPTRSTMRRFLAGRPSPDGPPTKVRMWRNCSVEHLFSPIEFYGALNDRTLVFAASGYDDALAFAELTDDGSGLGEGDVDVVVVERDRLALDDESFDAFVDARAEWLARVAGHPVVVAVVGTDPARLTVRVAGEERWRLEDPSVVNPDAAKSVGSVLSAAGSALLARELGAVWVPAALGAQCKLLAVDLDGTLHDGVLGEIGLAVEVTPAHRRLQEELLAARERGLMVAVVTKNDPADVDELLTRHPGYVLRPEHLVAVEAGWDAKSLAVERLVQRTHVGADTVVFVDDNFAELAQVGAALPAVALVSCERGADRAADALQYVEGYRTHRTDDLADTRVADIASDDERRELLEASLGAYIEQAAPEIAFLAPDADVAARLGDLSARSNQFNLTLGRTDTDDFVGALEPAAPARAVAARVRDRFSDSGVVAGLLVRAEGGTGEPVVRLEELFMSCRVIGRGLEDAIAFGALDRAMGALGADAVRLRWRRGPRNEPALRWLGRALPDLDLGPEEGEVLVDRSEVAARATPPEGVTVVDQG